MIAAHDNIGGRDAVHAATALEHGLTTIVSTDPAFLDLPGVECIEPGVAADRV